MHVHQGTLHVLKICSEPSLFGVATHFPTRTYTNRQLYSALVSSILVLSTSLNLMRSLDSHNVKNSVGRDVGLQHRMLCLAFDIRSGYITCTETCNDSRLFNH